MTKEDILKMNNSKDIMVALSHSPELWSEETSNHLRDTKRNENIKRFGDADVLYTPPKK